MTTPTDPAPTPVGVAEELQFWASYFTVLAAESYPESVWPPPKLGVTASPDAYAAAGYRNAYLNAAADLRARAAELLIGSLRSTPTEVPR